IEFVPEALVYYRRENTASVSRGRSSKQAQSAFSVCQLYTERLLAVRDDIFIRKALRQEYLRFIDTYYPHHKKLIRQAKEKIRELGFNRLGSSGGELFQAFCLCVGFMNALRIRAWSRSLLFSLGRTKNMLAQK
ncbi:MAG: hypothetical protein AAFY76_13450, partial [Cyanobacteria bacterium J06649_11]